jgi:hypothetical protein
MAMAVSSIHWLVRPHAFTFLLLALWAYGLEKIYTGEDKKNWHLPVLMLVWANMHGAFIAGFVVWGAYAADWIWNYYFTRSATKEAGRRLALTGLFSFLLTFVNPAGWHLWETSVGYIGSSYLVDRTVEYMSPNFHQTPMLPFLLMLALGFLFLAGGRRLPVRDALLLAGWAVMGLYSARNIPLFAIVAAPVYGILLQDWAQKSPALTRQDGILKKNETRLRGYFWLVASVLIAGFISSSAAASARNQYDPAKFPVQAVDWLQDHPQEGNVFNDFVWGGYLLYRMYPSQTVFIDGQTDFYGEALTREYEQMITTSPGWEDVLKKYDVEGAILPQASPLSNRLRQNPQWTVIHEDRTAVILRVVEPYR